MPNSAKSATTPMNKNSITANTTLQEIRNLLKEHKLRATSSRIAVMLVMHEQQVPMTHEEIMSSFPTGASFDKASIWRVLADLTERGLLLRMDLGDRVWRFELIDACRKVANQHAHFLCQECSTVYCLPPVTLQIDGPVPKALQGIEMQVRVTGQCKSCA